MTIVDDKECIGCGACQNICSQKAINMVHDNEGFLMPKIDKSKCTNCKLCCSVCPILNKKELLNYNLKCFAAINKNEEIRVNSSSGGIFSLISNYIFDNNGAVIGAKFDENNRLNHTIAESNDELKDLMGSKYIQSNTSDVYIKIKKMLDKDKYVYFVGTPCQVAGLKCFLRKEYENLLCSDLICHGVPSTKIFNLYLKEKSQNGNNIQKIYFRNKLSGWKNFSIQLIGQKNIYIMNHKKDMFFKLFLKNLILRESCYNCKFKSINSYADITLGDFWGVNNIFSNIDDDRGVSAILIRNRKGMEVWKKLLRNVESKECEVTDISKYNSALIKSVIRPKSRDNILKQDINRLSELKKYLKKPSIIKRVLLKIKKNI